jgi:hypothetical protein
MPYAAKGLRKGTDREGVLTRLPTLACQGLSIPVGPVPEGGHLLGAISGDSLEGEDREEWSGSNVCSFGVKSRGAHLGRKPYRSRKLAQRCRLTAWGIHSPTLRGVGRDVR